MKRLVFISIMLLAGCSGAEWMRALRARGM